MICYPDRDEDPADIESRGPMPLQDVQANIPGDGGHARVPDVCGEQNLKHFQGFTTYYNKTACLPW